MNSKFFKKQKKILKSFSLYNINSKNNSNINRFNSTEKVKNLKKIKTIKKHFSFKKNVNNRFYKLLRNYNNNSWSKYKKRASPNIIDKNTFNFSLKDENNEILRRTFNIINGDKKHIQYCNIANKKEIDKLNSTKEFREKMKIIQNNLQIIKKNNLEEKKKMKELMMIRKIKNQKNQDLIRIKLETNANKFGKNNLEDKKKLKKININRIKNPDNVIIKIETKHNLKFNNREKLEKLDKQLNEQNDKLMNKYNKIMKRIKEEKKD